VQLGHAQFANAFCCRSERLSVFSGPFANRWLNLAVLCEIALLIEILYVPFFSGCSARSVCRRRIGC
jgi:Ca2+-transporting ATPase